MCHPETLRSVSWKTPFCLVSRPRQQHELVATTSEINECYIDTGLRRDCAKLSSTGLPPQAVCPSDELFCGVAHWPVAPTADRFYPTAYSNLLHPTSSLLILCALLRCPLVRCQPANGSTKPTHCVGTANTLKQGKEAVSI